jgi:hypothetical protein
MARINSISAAKRCSSGASASARIGRRRQNKENIITESGDLIENRSPELVAQARAALRHDGDETPRQAE